MIMILFMVMMLTILYMNGYDFIYVMERVRVSLNGMGDILEDKRLQQQSVILDVNDDD